MIKKERIKIEKEFLWLMLIEEIDYQMYKRMITIFGSISEIYRQSQNKELFQRKIYSNDIVISNKIYSQELKNKADIIYTNLLNQDIKIISLDSTLYPKKLLNIYNPPFVILEYGDVISKMRNQKMIYFYENHLSKFGKKVYQYFNYHIKYKMLRIGEKEKSDIFVEKENILDEKYVNRSQDNRIIIPHSKNSLEMILGLTDYLLIIEARYNQDTKNMVNNIIEQGKEILVVPGNIFNKNHYFSNYLIQEGATVLLNKYDLDKFV